MTILDMPVFLFQLSHEVFSQPFPTLSISFFERQHLVRIKSKTIQNRTLQLDFTETLIFKYQINLIYKISRF